MVAKRKKRPINTKSGKHRNNLSVRQPHRMKAHVVKVIELVAVSGKALLAREPRFASLEEGADSFSFGFGSEQFGFILEPFVKSRAGWP